MYIKKILIHVLLAPERAGLMNNDGVWQSAKCVAVATRCLFIPACVPFGDKYPSGEAWQKKLHTRACAVDEIHFDVFFYILKGQSDSRPNTGTFLSDQQS